MSTIRRLPDTVRDLLLVTLFGLVLVTPLLRWLAVPCTHDGHLHYHRIAALRYAWEHGLAFSRWLPDLAFGYGYPFFIYREPAPLYMALLPHLAGLPLPAAENLVYVLSILAAGWFTYLWVRDIMGSRAAIVSAVVYMATPYLLIDALIRGNIPESVALAWLPLLLWSGRRWLLRGTAATFAASAFGLAGLALTHNISLLIFTPALLIYLALVGWLNRLKATTWLWRMLLLFGLGLGMAIFFTGGALLEMDAVTLSQSTTTRNNDFHFNFASAGELLAPVAAANPDLLNAPLLFRLGWAPLLLALTGLASIAWVKAREQRGHIVLMAVAASIYLLLTLPLSLPVWENLPLIEFLQFPWRFVGRAALSIAFLAGVPFSIWTTRPERDEREPSRAQGWSKGRLVQAGALAAVALVMAEAVPNLYPHACLEDGFPGIEAVHAYERSTGLVGVDPEGSYFPVTVEERPAGSALESDYLAGQTPRRLDVGQMQAGTRIEEELYLPNEATMVVDSPTPFTARFLSFAFPGWTAAVDGAPVAITPGDPDGLITFAVPAGRHAVHVAWQSTPQRSLLTAASIAALAAAVSVVLWLWSMGESRRRKVGGQPYRRPSGGQRLTVPEVVTLGLLALAFLAFKLVVGATDTPLRASRPPVPAQATAIASAGLKLEGFDLSQRQVAAGEAFAIDLAWRAQAPLVADYQSNVWLVDPQGLAWSDKETQRPRLYEDAPPTRAWQVGQWAWDSREVRVLPGTPPGTYDIELTLFDLADLQPLTLVDSATGGVLGPVATIGRIEVEAGTVAPSPHEALVSDIPELGLELQGYSQDRSQAAPGEETLLTLFWKRVAPEPAPFLSLGLQSVSGKLAQSWHSPLLPAGSSGEWPAASVLRGQYLVRLAAGLEAGEYEFVLENGPVLGRLEVVGPERRFAPPAVAHEVGAHFREEGALPLTALAGFNASQESGTLNVALVWQVLGETSESYRVFVHVVDENGAIVAQSDGEPAGWTRPTTGWLPPEYIVDDHVIPLPPEPAAEALSLRIGLYDAATGRRLLTESGDYVTVPIPAE